MVRVESIIKKDEKTVGYVVSLNNRTQVKDVSTAELVDLDKKYGLENATIVKAANKVYVKGAKIKGAQGVYKLRVKDISDSANDPKIDVKMIKKIGKDAWELLKRSYKEEGVIACKIVNDDTMVYTTRFYTESNTLESELFIVLDNLQLELSEATDKKEIERLKREIEIMEKVQ